MSTLECHKRLKSLPSQLMKQAKHNFRVCTLIAKCSNARSGSISALQQTHGLTREKRCGWGLLLLWGDSMGEDGEREDGEEGDGEREEAWRKEGDRLRSMAGGVKQDPGRSWEEDRESRLEIRDKAGSLLHPSQYHDSLISCFAEVHFTKCPCNFTNALLFAGNATVLATPLLTLFKYVSKYFKYTFSISLRHVEHFYNPLIYFVLSSS